jgi:hypothetical protein
MGLVIVFLDVGSNGWDWIADPVGWILVLLGLAPVKELVPGHAGAVAAAWGCLAVSVLTLPPNSVDSIAPALGWLFSLPTVGFCVLLCSALARAVTGSLATRFTVLLWAFVVVAGLPGLVYLAGWDRLTVPTAVAAVLANITLVFSVWAAADEEPADGEPSGAGVPGATSTTLRPWQEREAARSRNKDQGFDAEAVKRRVRRERGEE